jgi:hypothetical protein
MALARSPANGSAEVAHRQAGLLVVRLPEVRVAGLARSTRVCSDRTAVGWPGVHALLSTVIRDRRLDDLRREPAQAVATAPCAMPSRYPVGFVRLHAFPSLCWVRPQPRDPAAKRSRTPSVQSVPDEATGTGVTPVQLRHRPRSQNQKPPASRLVALSAPSVAFGLGLSVLAAGPAPDRHYSYGRRLSSQTSKFRLFGCLSALKGAQCTRFIRCQRPDADATASGLGQPQTQPRPRQRRRDSHRQRPSGLAAPTCAARLTAVRRPADRRGRRAGRG